MASAEDILRLRKITAEEDSTTYEDAYLGALLDAEGTLSKAAVVIWKEKAAKASVLVNTSESGSSRSANQIYTNAVRMIELYAKESAEDPSTPAADDYPFVVDIERA